MEKIREILSLLDGYPRGRFEIGAALASLSVLSLGGVHFIRAYSPDNFPVGEGLLGDALIFFSLLGVLYVLFDLVLYWRWRGRGIVVEGDISSAFRRMVSSPNCNKVRVFCSAGEEAKRQLLSLTQEHFLPARHVEVHVLLRTDGSDERMLVLKNVMKTWRRDIDEVTSGKSEGYVFKTNFALYHSPVMLKGYVFSDNAALLAWYSKGEAYTSAPTLPMFRITKSGPGSKIVCEAIKTFDHHFSKGVIDDQGRDI